MTAEKKVKPEELAEIIANASVIELNEAIKVLEEKYGITVQSPVMAAPVAPAAAAAEVEEKSSFNVVLVSVGDKKIDVIKAVRDITQKGLKEAKDLVDAAAAAPQVIKENAKKDEAEDLKKKFESVGAKIELK